MEDIKNEKLNLANENSVQIKGKGAAWFKTNVLRESKVIHLENIWLVPDLLINLLSVFKITDHGYKVILDKNRGLVLDQDGNIRLTANKTNNLYVVEKSIDQPAVAEKKCITDAIDTGLASKFQSPKRQGSPIRHLSEASERRDTEIFFEQ